jgi:hypothetical protein
MEELDTGVHGVGASAAELDIGLDEDSLVEAVSYTIVTVGDTNWVAIGASTGSIGEVFTRNATASGSGTGIAVETALAWTIDEWTGYVVHNTTDGSSAAILSNTISVLTTEGMTGGTSNDWQVGEDYVIIESFLEVPHGLSKTEVRTAEVTSAIIQNDQRTMYYDFAVPAVGEVNTRIITNQDVQLTFSAASIFNSGNFDNKVLNRGKIFLTYIPD